MVFEGSQAWLIESCTDNRSTRQLSLAQFIAFKPSCDMKCEYQMYAHARYLRLQVDVTGIRVVSPGREIYLGSGFTRPVMP